MSLENIRIVLVGPLYSGNIGSVCRAMGNMGISDLVLVAPRDLDLGEARKMACHTTPILDGRRVVDTLEEAIGDCGLALATSARRGMYRQHARTAREWAPLVVEESAGTRVALVFGREDKGLTNEELQMCHHIIQIPTTDLYQSLNLSQAVLVCCYELFVLAGEYQNPEEKSPPAPIELRERMFELWRDMLLRTGFMEAYKSDHMMQGFRRIMSRGAETTDDVRIMMGIARQSLWAANNLLPEESSECTD
jgi:TrmH family RNA methyltransferase